MAASTEFVALTDTLMGLADNLLEHQITDGEYKILVEGIARIRILYERTHVALPPPIPNPVPLAASHLVYSPVSFETLWNDGLITHGRGIVQGTDTLNRSYEIVRSDIHLELINPRTNVAVEYKLIFERKLCSVSRRRKMIGRVNRHPTKMLVMMTNTYQLGTRYALIDKSNDTPPSRGITIKEVDYSMAVRAVGR